jgi:HEAT repeats/Putative zinc-finger
MKCEMAKDNIALLHYGELPDELADGLEQHLAECEQCRSELESFGTFEEHLAMLPVLEPSPNLLAQSRMRLDDALDLIPPHGFSTRLRMNLYRWLGHVQSAPALATLLLGVGFLAGNFTYRYEVAHAPKPIRPGVTISHPAEGVIANVTGIVRTPNSELVQVNYNRLVPETAQGSLDDPQIRQLLMLGTKLATTNDVHANSAALLASECKAGHSCESDDSGSAGIRSALLVLLRTDRSPAVRMKALEGLQPYVAQDEHVRNAVLDSLMHDKSEDVRTQAISLLTPVQADSSVRQVLRTVSSQDANPAIRTASFQALRGTADIE